MDTAQLVFRAEWFCWGAHAGKERDGGKPYATHPTEVARILRQRGHTDPVLQAAAFLHDTVEDTPTTREYLETVFGKKVASIVMQVTNPLPHGSSFAKKQKALLRLAAAMSSRAKLVKLADRLNNLRDMGVWCPAKQRRYAKATIDLLEALRPWPDPGLAEMVQTEALRRLGCPRLTDGGDICLQVTRR